VAHLVANPQPDCDTPGQLYLDCVLLLQAKGDEAKAAQLWRQAVAVIRRQANGIDEVQSRAAFLTGVQVHQRLFTLDLAHNPQ